MLQGRAKPSLLATYPWALKMQVVGDDGKHDGFIGRFESAFSALTTAARVLVCDVIVVGSNPLLNAIYATKLMKRGLHVAIFNGESHEDFPYAMIKNENMMQVIANAIGMRETSKLQGSFVEQILVKLHSDIESSIHANGARLSTFDPRITLVGHRNRVDEALIMRVKVNKHKAIDNESLPDVKAMLRQSAAVYYFDDNELNSVLAPACLLTSKVIDLFNFRQRNHAVLCDDPRVLLTNAASSFPLNPDRHGAEAYIKSMIEMFVASLIGADALVDEIYALTKREL